MLKNMTAEYRSKRIVNEWDIGTTGNYRAGVTFQCSAVNVQTDIAVAMCRFIQ
jgi:hypothetical protein